MPPGARGRRSRSRAGRSSAKQRRWIGGGASSRAWQSAATGKHVTGCAASGPAGRWSSPGAVVEVAGSGGDGGRRVSAADAQAVGAAAPAAGRGGRGNLPRCTPGDAGAATLGSAHQLSNPPHLMRCRYRDSPSLPGAVMRPRDMPTP
ncbi:hypothetical protein BDY21DRAFT_418991 [Lineolata rhizophorae]|uniref:Uncharacterized protein n=1 Tax=Lineolata rhizophorae TaxID=578093 RepID=A0A6A6PCG9_9PEZI|nr:hypothetical protein BDY21DRAFT_418991 [Lineolata rhizophorae]